MTAIKFVGRQARGKLDAEHHVGDDALESPLIIRALVRVG